MVPVGRHEPIGEIEKVTVSLLRQAVTVSPVSPALAFSRQRVVTISERVPPGPVLALSLYVLWDTDSAHNTRLWLNAFGPYGESWGHK